MSTPENTDTISVIYPGPHAEVYVPGSPDIARRDEPVDVPRELAERLVGQGWKTTGTEETPVDDREQTQTTETADAPPAGETPETAASETATPPASGDETASDPAARITATRRR